MIATRVHVQATEVAEKDHKPITGAVLTLALPKPVSQY